MKRRRVMIRNLLQIEFKNKSVDDTYEILYTPQIKHCLFKEDLFVGTLIPRFSHGVEIKGASYSSSHDNSQIHLRCNREKAYMYILHMLNIFEIQDCHIISTLICLRSCTIKVICALLIKIYARNIIYFT